MSVEWLIDRVSRLTRMPRSRLRAKTVAHGGVSLARSYPDGDDPELELLVPASGLYHMRSGLVLASSLTVGLVAAVTYLQVDDFDDNLARLLVVHAVCGVCAWCAPSVVDWWGRKACLVASHLAVLVGAGLLLGDQVLAALVILSAAAGIVHTVAPLFLAETAPMSHRGAVGFAHGAAVCLGLAGGALLLLTPLLEHMDDPVKADGAAMIAVAATAGALSVRYLPEAPRWLLRQGDLERLLRTLKDQGVIRATAVEDGLTWLRTSDDATDAQVDNLVAYKDRQVFLAIHAALEKHLEAPNPDASTFDLGRRAESATVVAVALGAAVGVGAGGAFALRAKIDGALAGSGNDDASFAFFTEAWVMPSCFAVTATVLASGTLLVRRLGRKMVLCYATCGMAVGTFLVLGATHFFDGGTNNATATRSFALAGYVTYVASQQLAVGTVLWIILVELFDCFDRPAALGLVNAASQAALGAVEAAAVASSKKGILIACLGLAAFALGLLAFALTSLPSDACGTKMNFTGSYARGASPGPSPNSSTSSAINERAPLLSSASSPRSPHPAAPPTDASTEPPRRKKHEDRRKKGRPHRPRAGDDQLQRPPPDE